MGKPGPKQIPVTARVQKGTKGGIVQPSISGMGSIAKMKKAPMKKSLVGNQDQLPTNLQASIKTAPGKTYGSPAKVVSRSRSGYKGVTKKPSEAPKSKSGYTDMTFAEYRKSGLMKPEEAKFYKGSGTKRVKTSNKNENTTTPPVTPPSTPPVTPPSTTTVTPPVTTTVTPPVTPPSNSGSGGSNTKNVKITGRIGSDLRRKQYDAKGWAYDDTIKKPKAKAIKAIKAKSVKSVAKPKAKIETKLAAAPAKPTKKQVRKAKSVERKTERAAKVRRKGVQALESGNLAKSRRLRRREARINKRIEKKKSGQASKAIEPK